MPTFSEADIMALVSPVFWPFLRVLAVFSSAPIFSARSVPVRSRVALAFLIAVCAQAGLPEQPVVALTDPNAFAVVLQQVVVGVAIGLAVRIVFASVELAGEIIGLQMGLNYAGFFDPSTNQQTSAVGRFFGNTTMLLFVVLNGHLMVLQAVVSSFETFPVGASAFESINRLRLHELGAVVFRYGLWIALPMIGMLLFINIVLGFVSRIAPQMNAFAIGFPITLSAGLLGIAFTLPMLDAPVVALMKLATDIFTGG
ncbi:MAG: flagellar biosynthetic protein FliR [Burkholderiales bacterium RIFCSPLOWO2_12_67_14]|uniref:Flagellar biosynthetic protein FliR n=1 Tax=Hydrogenophaga taeniospiralis CCUG 15921 TaxID=1281780 RepID=A0A9X4SDG8_9BURK|nr:flagellar biosynthetic protein FliR [Hydrogenophaga taeniospiralis]OGB19685.1 MAG: flagellar biosynthetic protein FliR [Burkholderiales bacterium RIFCSPLOWO2_02_FULL_67_64]OGB38023.1 MAG: flagellar biosynthetic protein FliR [Burkholderiales bacterium RIFCSPHIGHO2_12_FULL_67_38]OGB39110.1 MAG: flagellar biosynthetic protein FliR [Burkholderiales bacterium RIFCSPLOWO2_12_67_14]OGB74646.1 MAG: flagellar biosynthetic protein FliR [Burkholderiales bacterium RIFCSPLOWO2_12_FULL_67_210]MDG5977883.